MLEPRADFSRSRSALGLPTATHFPTSGGGTVESRNKGYYAQ